MDMTADTGRSRSAGCMPLTVFLLSLLVFVGVRLVRSGQGSVMQKGVVLEGGDPFLPIVAVAVALAAGIAVFGMAAGRRRRVARACADCRDFTHTFDRVDDLPAAADAPVAPPFEGVMLVPDASVAEVAELARGLEAQGIRFFTRQTVIDNAFHWLGNGGMGTRMCVFVHPDDEARARSAVERVLKVPKEREQTEEGEA